MPNSTGQESPKLTGTFKKLLLDLATSLLNATLLLLIAVFTLILLIFYQVERVSDNLAEWTKLPSDITVALQEDAFLMELERFRDNVALLNNRLESNEAVISAHDFQTISEQLTALEQTVAAGFDQCSVKFQQMIVLAIQNLLRSAAQLAMPPSPDPAVGASKANP